MYIWYIWSRLARCTFNPTPTEPTPKCMGRTCVCVARDMCKPMCSSRQQTHLCAADRPPHVCSFSLHAWRLAIWTCMVPMHAMESSAPQSLSSNSNMADLRELLQASSSCSALAVRRTPCVCSISMHVWDPRGNAMVLRAHLGPIEVLSYQTPSHDAEGAPYAMHM